MRLRLSMSWLSYFSVLLCKTPVMTCVAHASAHGTLLSSTEPEAATGADDVLATAARRPRRSLHSDAIPRHLHARGGGRQNQSSRISRSGIY